MALKNTSSPQCLSPLSKSTEFPFNLSELSEISSYSAWIVLFPEWSQGLRCDMYQSCIPLCWLAAILFYVCSTSVHHWIVPDVGVPACCSYPQDCCCEHQDTQIYSNLVFSLWGTTRNGATRAHGCFALDFNWPCQITFCSSGPSHGYSDFSEFLPSCLMVPFNKQRRLNGWEVASHCGLGLHFHNALVVQIFLWACWASMHLWRRTYPTPLPGFKLSCFNSVIGDLCVLWKNQSLFNVWLTISPPICELFGGHVILFVKSASQCGWFLLRHRLSIRFVPQGHLEMPAGIFKCFVWVEVTLTRSEQRQGCC